MTAFDASAYRSSEPVLPPMASSSTGGAAARRATVGSPPPYTYTNVFEPQRPASRSDRLGFDYPYRYRRSTISHSEGHNVNDAPSVVLHGDPYAMLSESASPSPVMPHASLLPGPSTTPSSSCGSPKPAHTYFDPEHPSFAHPLHSPIHSFSLCPSPDFPSHLGHPRSMPPPLVPSSFSSGSGSTIRPPTSGTGGTSTTPALSPAASSTSFGLDAGIDASSSSSPRHISELPPSSIPREELESELTHLRHRVRDLEFINDLVRLRVAELESDSKSHLQQELGLQLDLTPDPTPSGTPFPSSSSASNASPAYAFINQELGPAPVDWAERTSARLKRFCGLNRAGNALCAWHDSRRERRAYPPRMAPPNTLNCGCTYSEALFEESLARNGVGSFYPGEHVRMDPALRNPLLQLLEQRYGYRDGDFERTPNGGWKEGEDAHVWHQRATGARSSSKRDR